MNAGRKNRVGAALAMGLIMLARLSAVGLEPQSKGDHEEGSAVLERYLAVQGLDRDPATIYPREIEMKVSTGVPEKVFLKLHQVAFTPSPNLGEYWLEVELLEGAHRHYSEFREPTGKIWLLDKDLGVGPQSSPSKIVTALADERESADVLRKKYLQWKRLPDGEYKGKKVNVVGMRSVKLEIEFRYFDDETGVLVRVGGPLTDTASLDYGVTWSDFRKIDGKWEPFEKIVRTPTDQTIERITSLQNHVALSASRLGLSPKLKFEYAKSEAVIAKYVQASGGKRALEQITSRITKLKGEVTTTGSTFEMTIWQKLPDLVLIERKTPGVGDSWQGYDGDQAWQSSELQGFWLLHKDEMQTFVNNFDLHNTEENFANLFPLRRWNGEKEIDGHKTQVLGLSTLQAKAGTYYFDSENGRLLRIETVIGDRENILPVTIDYSNFQTAQGITVPFTTTLTNPAMKVVTTVQSLEHNKEIEDSLFRQRKSDP